MLANLSLISALFAGPQLAPPLNNQVAILNVQPEVQKTQKLICRNCSQNEQNTLAFLQEKGITDRNALATVMGNIKQESMFTPNICEGGARTSYRRCGAGWGLIQWTSTDRYYGLGDHARQIGGNPDNLETQLSYMLTESQWKSIEGRMKTPGLSIENYMGAAYRWIGWGIHGNRTAYAYDYRAKLVEVQS